MYDRDVPGEDARALACHDRLIHGLIDRGYLPYRLGIQSMDALPPAVDHTDQFLGRLKSAIDPNGILAPGRYVLAGTGNDLSCPDHCLSTCRGGYTQWTGSSPAPTHREDDRTMGYRRSDNPRDDRRTHRLPPRALTTAEKVCAAGRSDDVDHTPVERLGIPAIKVTDGPNGARGGSSSSAAT